MSQKQGALEKPGSNNTSQNIARSIAQQQQQQRLDEEEEENAVLNEDEEEDDEVYEDIGKAISDMASSIVAKDGRELFGGVPSRRVPINNISQSYF